METPVGRGQVQSSLTTQASYVNGNLESLRKDMKAHLHKCPRSVSSKYLSKLNEAVLSREAEHVPLSKAWEYEK